MTHVIGINSQQRKNMKKPTGEGAVTYSDPCTGQGKPDVCYCWQTRTRAKWGESHGRAACVLYSEAWSPLSHLKEDTSLFRSQIPVLNVAKLSLPRQVLVTRADTHTGPQHPPPFLSPESLGPGGWPGHREVSLGHNLSSQRRISCLYQWKPTC